MKLMAKILNILDGQFPLNVRSELNFKLLFKIVWSGGAKEINLKEKRSIGISFLISLMIVISTSLMLMLDKDSFHYPTLEVGKG